MLLGFGLSFASGAWADAGADHPRGPSMSQAVLPLSWDADQGLPALPAEWSVVEGHHARIHHDPADHALALDLARHAAASVPAFADRLGIAAGPTIDIVLAHTQEQFDDLQPGSPPDWADGTAWPSRGLVFLRANRIRPGTEEPLPVVLDHEIIHILMGRAFDDQPVPRWLQEGVAQVWARQFTAATTETLAKGLLGRDLLSLSDLASGFPADPVQARLAYAQSADFVAWLQNEHGPQAIPTVVHRMAGGASFGMAMREATGLTTSELDAQWRSRLESSGLWLTPLLSETAFLGVGSVVLLVGGVGVLRRRREQMAHMAAEEEAREAMARAMGQPSEMAWWDFPHPVPPSQADGPRPWVH